MGRDGSGGGLGVRDVLIPWRLARLVYGPYGVSTLRAAFRRGEFGAEAEVAVADQQAIRIGLDPVLRFLVPVRAWVGLGVVVLAVKTISNPDPLVRLQDAWFHGAVTMVLGPFGVLLGIAFLVVIARRNRRAALRAMARPAGIAVLTVPLSVGVFGLQLPVVRRAVQRVIDSVVPASAGSGDGWWLLAAVAGPWLLVFGVCAVYLMHRNGFSTHSSPYLRPIVAAWLSCVVAAVELTVSNRTSLPDLGFTVSTLAGPLLVIALSAVEAVRLHRLDVAISSPP